MVWTKCTQARGTGGSLVWVLTQMCIPYSLSNLGYHWFSVCVWFAKPMTSTCEATGASCSRCCCFPGLRALHVWSLSSYSVFPWILTNWSIASGVCKVKEIGGIYISGLSNHLGKQIQKPRTGFEERTAIERREQPLIPDKPGNLIWPALSVTSPHSHRQIPAQTSEL